MSLLTIMLGLCSKRFTM